MPAFIIRHSSFRICLLLVIELLVVLALSRCAHAAPCANGACVVQHQAAVSTNFIVTQFAVPVAVPQYAIPVAPASYVQYGTGTIAHAPFNPGDSPGAKTTSNDMVEDRIAAKILARLTSAGVLKNEALPSLVRTSCVSCHGGAQPKAGLDLSNPRSLAPELRLRAIGRVLVDDDALRMPPASSGVKLSPEDLGKLLQELSMAGVAAGGSPAPSSTESPK